MNLLLRLSCINKQLEYVEQRTRDPDWSSHVIILPVTNRRGQVLIVPGPTSITRGRRPADGVSLPRLKLPLAQRARKNEKISAPLCAQTFLSRLRSCH